MLILQRNFTKWDDTDAIKRMKDSDILAEDEKSNKDSYVDAGKSVISGSAAGAATGLATASILALSKKLNIPFKEAAKLYATYGAAAGGILSGSISLAKSHSTRKDNKRYNDRLRYAKKQALRREERDWQNQATNREEYSY